MPRNVLQNPGDAKLVLVIDSKCLSNWVSLTELFLRQRIRDNGGERFFQHDSRISPLKRKGHHVNHFLVREEQFSGEKAFSGPDWLIRPSCQSESGLKFRHFAHHCREQNGSHDCCSFPSSAVAVYHSVDPVSIDMELVKLKFIEDEQQNEDAARNGNCETGDADQ